MRRGGWTLFGAGAVLLAIPGLARTRPGIAYDAVARTYLAREGFREEPPAVEELLAKRFVHARLGLFETTLPAADLAEHAARFQASARALLDAQARWLEWMKPVVGAAKEPRADLKMLGKWVEGWKTDANPALDAAKVAGADAFAIFGASDKVLAARDRLATFMGSGAAVGVQRDPPVVVHLCLQPTRRGFVEFLAFAGLVFPDDRPAYWCDAMPDWVMAFVGEQHVVALEYAQSPRPPEAYAVGSPMEDRSPNGLAEQVAQLAMNGLCEQYFGPRIPKAFAQGLAMNLVIDLYGEVATRIDGDLRAKHTAAREVFVPGGASSGGALAPLSAESRWRAMQGKDHFVSVLRLVQEEGMEAAQGADRRVDCFALRDTSGGNVSLYCAPLLGSAAADKPGPPGDFHGDYLEFLRAYKSCFMHWLQTAAGGKRSEDRFAELLKRLAAPETGTDFETVFRDLYEHALSAAAIDGTTLEGQFLTWVSKQR